MFAGLKSWMRRSDSKQADAAKLYGNIMVAARHPSLFGAGKFIDTYDGRIEALTLYMAMIMGRLGDLGEDGERLRQAIFDKMVDDFDVAMREEGLSDTGISRRIKPMIGLFYTRLKVYTDAFRSDPPKAALQSCLEDIGMGAETDGFLDHFINYLLEMHGKINSMSLDNILEVQFNYQD